MLTPAMRRNSKELLNYIWLKPLIRKGSKLLMSIASCRPVMFEEWPSILQT